MATKKRSTRRRKAAVKRHKHNPGSGMTFHTANPRRRHRRAGAHLFRSHIRRHRRNPEGSSAAMDPAKGNNILQFAAGAFVGSIATPVISKMIGFEGYAKYAVQLGASYGLYLLGKMFGMPKAGLAACIAGVGVTAYQFSQEQGLLQGVSEIMGLVPPAPSFNSGRFAQLQNFANMAGQSDLVGIVPQPATMGSFN